MGRTICYGLTNRINISDKTSRNFRRILRIAVEKSTIDVGGGIKNFIFSKFTDEISQLTVSRKV